jgi:3-deoxy-manno-octulosonate cytidylyltransferase (CMP-KDO synthetase)
MKILGIIPARFASTRFPGKPLIDLAGKTMIQRVYGQAKLASSLTEVVVATDDQRIFDAVEAFGGKAIFTSEEHQSGTDRCAEVAEKMNGFDAVINIQGDEPLINPVQIDLVASCFEDNQTQLATLIKIIKSEEELFNFNSPKVIINKNFEAIYFSRQVIPHIKNTEPKDLIQHHTFYKHIGIYGYKTETLQEISKLPIGNLEKAEILEQLRWIENGYKIMTALSNHESWSIDTPQDLKKIQERFI